MGCLGTHFAVTEEEVRKLESFPTDEDRLAFLSEEIEEPYYSQCPDLKVDSDKAWDDIHRALTDGRFGTSNGSYPRNHVIMGGESLYGKSDWIIILKTLDQVRDIANSIDLISENEFRQGYFQIDPDECGWEIDENGFTYSWEYFLEIRMFYRRAADLKRFVLFTASQ